jgi:hypothetical protein
MNPPRAFISYNKGDKAVATDIAIFLAAENVSVWFDEWMISAGDSIVEAVNAGLRDCTHFIVIWSKNAATSMWVNRELASTLGKAVASGSPRVIPVVLDDTPKPPLICDLKQVEYHGGKEEDRRMIVEAVTGEAPSQNFIRAVVRKYYEVISSNDDDPFGLAVCPRCGGNNLRRSSHSDESRTYFFLACKECGWNAMTE